jgi:glycerol-3-phosphate responsive antiterminator
MFFRETPIIPAVRNPEHLDQAIAAHGKIIYLLSGDPENCETMIQKILASGELPILKLDLPNAFSRQVCRKLPETLWRARNHLYPLVTIEACPYDRYAIRRTFLLNSGPKNTITNQLKNTPVDALEVLPARVAPKLLDRMRAISPDIPVVSGKLIWAMKEAEDLLLQGLDAVSISNPQMWIT